MTHLVLAILAITLGSHQAPKGNAAPGSLSDFVQALQWDPAKRGPLMVLEPDAVRAKKGLEGLAAYGRTRTSLTGLSAIVPDTMVVIDDSMQQAPNMYDGLPRASKVLYLMSTLDNGQWKAVTGSGLGFNDLSKDQQAVFQSLMPKPFSVQDYTVGAGGRLDRVDQLSTVAESDLPSIRLHVERSLQFMMPIVGMPGAMTARNTARDFGREGAHVLMRNVEDDFQKQDSFGVKIRQTAPNQLKPSDLDYRSSGLSGMIDLEPSEKASDLLARVGKAAGLEIHADLRVGEREMVSIGGTAPIVSVLKTVALCVTGTYRKVGAAYILTSDLVGMGTRKMRLAAYDDELNQKVRNEEDQWRLQIYKSGHLKDIKFRDGDQLSSDDNLAQKIDQGQDVRITAGDLNEALREFIQRQNEITKSQQVTADGATVQSDYAYSFIMPNGEITHGEIQTLGTHDLFQYAARQRPSEQPLPEGQKLAVADVKVPFAVCIAAGSADAAEHAVAKARHYGFRDLWLDTYSPAVLKAAIRAAAGSSLRISLAVHPFTYCGPEDDPSADRTLFGDTPSESYQRRMAETDSNLLNRLKTLPPEPVGCISPLSDGFKRRVALVAECAKTAGLAGVYVLDSTPNGYNGPRVRYHSYPPSMFLEKGNFGYAQDLRLAFLRLQNVDPIDLSPDDVRTNSDLLQPFFVDDNLRGSSTSYDGTDAPNPAMSSMMAGYDTWLAKIHHTALQTMLDGIVEANPQVHIMVDPIPLEMNAVNRGSMGLLPWKSGDPLPEFSEKNRSAPADKPVRAYHYSVVAEENMGLAEVQVGFLGKVDAATFDQMGLAGMTLDLRRLTPSQVDIFMDRAFAAPTQTTRR